MTTCAAAPTQLGADFDAHVAFVIAALEARADELELHGRAPGGA